MEHDERWIRRFGLMGAVGWLIFMLINHSVFAHDTWANNTPVPSWVKAACCGPIDIHNLTLEGRVVFEVTNGWRIEGLNNVVPRERTFPSQDGYSYAFYKSGGPSVFVDCLFISLGE